MEIGDFGVHGVIVIMEEQNSDLDPVATRLHNMEVINAWDHQEKTLIVHVMED